MNDPSKRAKRGGGKISEIRAMASYPYGKLSEDELQLLRKPEIPVKEWQQGKSLFESKLEWPDIANNSSTKAIRADKAKLRKLIATEAQLVKDFEFFTRKLGAQPEALLQELNSDCNMMHATLQSIIAGEKKRCWSIDQEELENLHKELLAFMVRLERLSQTSFSPGRTAILRDERGVRLSVEREAYLLGAFCEMPGILRAYASELRRKVQNIDAYWSKTKESWKTLIEISRSHCLYERIYAKLGKYHAVRLHRLVNAARRANDLPELEWFAFRKWLSEMKTRRVAASGSASNGPS